MPARALDAPGGEGCRTTGEQAGSRTSQLVTKPVRSHVFPCFISRSFPGSIAVVAGCLALTRYANAGFDPGPSAFRCRRHEAIFGKLTDRRHCTNAKRRPK